MTSEVILDWPPSVLSPNSHNCWQVKSKAGKQYKHDVYYLCKAAGLAGDTSGLVHLSINFHPPSRHSFDHDNPIAQLKFGLDSIAEYLRMNDRDFRFHWVYHVFNPDFKGKVVVEIIPDPNMANVVKIREQADNGENCKR
jgi:crossover junction endodeoxyribonuclease RusA